MVTDVFLHNGGQCNVRVHHMFILFKIYFCLLKSPDPSYSVLKFGDKLYSRNRDMAQNVILQGCDLERSMSSVKVNKFSIRPRHPPISTHVKFHWNLIIRFLVTVFQSLTERWPGRRKMKKKDRIWQKHFNTGWHFVMQITSWISNLTWKWPGPDLKISS